MTRRDGPERRDEKPATANLGTGMVQAETVEAQTAAIEKYALENGLVIEQATVEARGNPV